MLRQVLLWFGFFLLQNGVKGNSFTMTIDGADMTDSGHYHVTPGQNVTIQCQIPDDVTPSADNPALIKQTNTEGDVIITIANHEGLLLTSETRYSFKCMEEGGKCTAMQLTITGVRESDNGDYTCGLGTSTEDDLATLHLMTSSDNKDIKSQTNSTDTKIATQLPIGLSGNNTLKVEHHNATAPAKPNNETQAVPADPIKPSSNESSVNQPKKAPEEEPKPIDEPKAKDPVLVKSDTPTMKPPTNATTTAGNQTSSDLPVFIGPMCHSEKEVGFKKSVRVICKVTSPSPINGTYFYWLTGRGKDNPETLTPKQQERSILEDNHDATVWAREGSYYGYVYEKDGATTMQFHIPIMYAQMYRKHYFVAQNSAGKAEHAVEFSEDPEDPVVYAGASGLCLSILSIVTTILMTFLAQ